MENFDFAGYELSRPEQLVVRALGLRIISAIKPIPNGDEYEAIDANRDRVRLALVKLPGKVTWKVTPMPGEVNIWM